ncbi:MAG: hypothetical protein ABI852_08940 [Gemmatimonadaceae bacterium]
MMPWTAGGGQQLTVGARVNAVLMMFAIASLAFTASPGVAQSAPPFIEQIAVIGTDFTAVTSVRELSDGRVLVVEYDKHNLLALLNPVTRKKVRVGAYGDGPGEYRSLSTLQAVGKDSTLMLESGGLRWQLLRHDSVITLPDAARGKRTPDLNGYAGMDARWNWLMTVGLSGKSRQSKIAPIYADSIGLIRFSITGKRDTLARLKGYNLGQLSRVPTVNGQRGIRFEVMNPLSTHEQAKLFTDGTIAIALLNPYRIDWILTNGTRTRGKPVEPNAPLSAKAKQVLVSQNMRNTDGTAVFTESDLPPFPLDVPAFLWRALHAGADGRLYVLRTLIDKDGPSTYDVFDRTGKRSQFRLPDRAVLIGSGTRGLYVTIRDENDLVSLALFKYPP